MSSPDTKNVPGLPVADAAADPTTALAEGDRGHVGRVLGVPAVLPSHDVMRMKGIIEEDYGIWTREVLRFYGLLRPKGAPCEGDVLPPSLDEVLKAFSSRELALAHRSIVRPTLTLAPVTSSERLATAFDTSRLKGAPINMPNHCRYRLAQLEQERGIGSRISGYQVAIDEFGQSPLQDLSPEMSPESSMAEQLIAWAQKNYPNGLRIVPLYNYLLFQMRAIKEGAPLNADDTFSALVSDSAEVREFTEVFGGGCPQGKLGISLCDIEHRDPFKQMQIRPSIVGNATFFR